MSPKEWDRLLKKIKQREKPSVYLIRNTMKEVLGFTVRTHEEWTEEPSSGLDDFIVDLGTSRFMSRTVRLDFYDEQKRTMFLLKYGNGKD